jgi:hypothetical protein
MGHLSPSVIDPYNLRILLSDIKSKLPPHVRLPNDEKRDIWLILTLRHNILQLIKTKQNTLCSRAVYNYVEVLNTTI